MSRFAVRPVDLAEYHEWVDRRSEHLPRFVGAAFAVLCWVSYLFAGHELGFAALAVLGVLFLTWISVGQQRRRREHSGLCRRCGYDLRATPDRCPECGAVAEAVRKRERNQ